MQQKPKIAFFDFAGCEGCQLQVLDLEDEIPELIKLVEIVNFREASSERHDDDEIAFVEGSITTNHDIERVKGIRERAKILVAFGACACTGGINAIKNTMPLEEVRRYVYGEKWKCFDTIPTKPVSAVVAVDYELPGCPPNKREFLELVKCLLMGKPFRLPNYPVCVECKLKENLCVFEKGMVCLGPITRAGCEAACPSRGNYCMGCRGLVDNPNVDSHREVLEKYGLTVEQILREFRLFGSNLEVLKDA